MYNIMHNIMYNIMYNISLKYCTYCTYCTYCNRFQLYHILYNIEHNIVMVRFADDTHSGRGGRRTSSLVLRAALDLAQSARHGEAVLGGTAQRGMGATPGWEFGVGR